MAEHDQDPPDADLSAESPDEHLDADDEHPAADAPPADITRDLFLVFRSPRPALRNPQRMTNPVWAWLARQPELSAWSANKKFDGPGSMEVGPGWCASRFGRSTTELPDGRTIEIGGEHEDYYDPDFYIYNDVVLKSPGGELDIYGYPHQDFPPTDFHSATLVGDRIIVIGRLGYAWQRAPGVTPVYALDTRTLAISPLTTGGDNPGWIHEHTAELRDDGLAIVVRAGKRLVERDGERDFVENIDDWSLDLASGVWTRLTDRRWPQWELARADGKSSDLFRIGNATWHVGRDTDYDREQLARLEADLGRLPDFALYEARYRPPVPHAAKPGTDDDDDDWNITRIVVDGVIVRYREESSVVHLMIEGSLPPAREHAIVEDARRKLAELEQTEYVARRLDA
jgi:hypothetical protein